LKPHLNSLSLENISDVRMRNSVDLPAALRLAGLVREQRIDIVHAHVARDYILAALASRLSHRTPFVLTRHVLFPLKRLHRATLSGAARVIAVSNAVKESLERQKIFDPDRLVTIHNGVDMGLFSGSRSSSGSDLAKPLRVGMIGHIASIKGQEDFVRAAADVTSKRGDVRFIIIGEDKSRDNGNRRALERLISELGLSDRIELAGWQDDVARVLSTLDIMVSPSRSEPFGLVILEAMAAGVPVIATASEGAVEIIEDGSTGRLVPIGEPKRLASEIGQLLDQPDERRRLAENARRAVETRFSIAKMADAVEAEYLRILSGPELQEPLY
jgi:glycosyltransferase involved in cell wall biosynthesis